MIDDSCAAFQRVELNTILGKQPLNIPCSQIRAPLKKTERGFSTFSMYVFMVVTTFVELHLFVFPYAPFSEWTFQVNLHFVFVNVFFLLAAFKDPGYAQSSEDIKFEKLVEKFDPNSLCPNCETMYSNDSRHCYICNRCINKFDHHCQWINNCVGKNNHYVFYTYILSLLLYFISLFTMCFLNEDKQLDFSDMK